MRQDPIVSGRRKAVNLSLDTGIVGVAREVGLNMSQISEAAIRKAVSAELAKRWQEENRASIEANNAWIEKHGLPLEKYRMF